MRLSDHDFLIWANFMTEFGENLRWLCGLRKSVSFVARELGINRQQFGRYVNNKSYPNTHNLIAICDYFNVQAADFELPHSEFSQKYRKVSLLKQGPAQRTLEFPLDAYFSPVAAPFRTVSRRLFNIFQHEDLAGSLYDCILSRVFA